MPHMASDSVGVLGVKTLIIAIVIYTNINNWKISSNLIFFFILKYKEYIINKNTIKSFTIKIISSDPIEAHFLIAPS